MRGDVRTNSGFVYIKSDSYFINRVSTLATRITKRFRRGFRQGFRQGFLLVMPGGETEGGSGGSSSASRSSGRTSVALGVGCFKSFNPKGEPHSLSQRWKRWRSIQSVHYRERSFG